MRHDIRIVDLGLHLITLVVLRNPFTMLPDLPLLFLIWEKRWVNDYDIRIRLRGLLHHWISLVVVYLLFGERSASGWLIHLLIDQITH